MMKCDGCCREEHNTTKDYFRVLNLLKLEENIDILREILNIVPGNHNHYYPFINLVPLFKILIEGCRIWPLAGKIRQKGSIRVKNFN